ncbi:hypothetical protein PIIN_10196 [Serendipita indica DSM 11827]|uniref:Uncharacterized protein n=1 Tax=Serendipita indica (strain DSM 11827) TaxID=1109443 RepID=G4TY10_SERID|nr:hypothetical protein PIIN_10196 [Serendipita indica DSM 11827]
MLRNHPCRVIVSWPKDQKIGYDDRPAAGRIIDSLNVHLAKANSATVNGVYWTEAGNLVIRIKTPDHAEALAGNFDQWRRQMLKGAQAARLDRKIHQVVIQGALIRDEHDQPLTADAIATHLTQATDIKLNDLAMPPRILAKPDTLMTLNRAPILVPLRDETKASRLKEVQQNAQTDHDARNAPAPNTSPQNNQNAVIARTQPRALTQTSNASTAPDTTHRQI